MSASQGKEITMPKYVVVAAVLIAVATPALAAEYYVVQDQTTKECEVGKYKPDGQTWVIVGTGAYATKEEAKAARKAAAECKNKEEAN
jgi:hypothetical protein